MGKPASLVCVFVILSVCAYCMCAYAVWWETCPAGSSLNRELSCLVDALFPFIIILPRKDAAITAGMCTTCTWCCFLKFYVCQWGTLDFLCSVDWIFIVVILSRYFVWKNCNLLRHLIRVFKPKVNQTSEWMVTSANLLVHSPCYVCLTTTVSVMLYIWYRIFYHTAMYIYMFFYIYI